MKKIFALVMALLGFCLVAISACSSPPAEPSITLSVSQEKVVLSNGEIEMIFASLTKDGQEVKAVYDGKIVKIENSMMNGTVVHLRVNDKLTVV